MQLNNLTPISKTLLPGGAENCEHFFATGRCKHPQKATLWCTPTNCPLQIGSIYFASPFFNEAEENFVDQTVSSLRKLGFKVFSPKEAGGIIPKGGAKEKQCDFPDKSGKCCDLGCDTCTDAKTRHCCRKDEFGNSAYYNNNCQQEQLEGCNNCPNYKTLAQEIFDGNIKAIDMCPIVVAVIDNFDSGTIWEMGYAHAKNKAIITVSRQGFGLNIMLAESAQAHFQKPAEFLTAMAHHIKTGEIPVKKWEGDVI